MQKYHLLLIVLSIFLVSFSQDNCILDGGLTVNPGPTPDPFNPTTPSFPSNTTVQFCYTVEEYNTAGTQNWMHGIVPLFGPGWDLNTLQPVGQPESQFDIDGEWIWTGNVTTGITDEFIAEPGWWFDANSGGGSLNGDPSDNWGDGNNGPWEFCWEITTQTCPPSFNEASLIIEITNYADSESGSWDVPSALNECINDASYFFYGKLDCPTCDESLLNIVNPTCATSNQGQGGVAILTPVGVGPWDFDFFDLSTGEVIADFNSISQSVIVNDLPEGDYFIYIEDLGFPGGCSAPLYFEILPPQEIIVELDIYNATCYDSMDGVIVIENIMNSGCIDNNLIADDINFDGVVNNDDFSCQSTINEVCGCDFTTYINSCQATNWYGITSFNDGPCPDSNPDYSISWNSLNFMNIVDNQVIDLQSGSYQLLIESQNNESPVYECILDTIISIESPTEFDYSYVINDVSCFLDNDNDGINDIGDGLISIEIYGGTPPYTTFFSGDLNSPQEGNVISFDQLNAGEDYYFTTIDANGCYLGSQEIFFEINEPDPVFISNVIVSSYNGYNVSCNSENDGFIDIEINGGNPPYSYLWSNGDVNQDATSLIAGEYSVQVTDAQDCIFISDNFILNQPEPIEVEVLNVTQVTCSGESDGSIDIEVYGGDGNYSYLWSNGLISQDINNLPLGIYTINVSDGNNCANSIDVNVETPNPILLSLDINNISCEGFNDGFVNTSVTGGSELYQYEWLLNGVLFSTNQNISNLVPGLYECIVTDSEGCTESSNFEIIEPDALTATVQTNDIACFDENTGTATINILGGTPPYNQIWDAGIDPNNLFAGTYSVTITDSNDCMFIIDNIIIDQPNTSLSINAQVIDVLLCNGDQTGEIIPLASGGTPPYQYFINNGSVFDLLSAGSYIVSVIDANGCYFEESFEVDEPNSVYAEINTIDVSCFGLSDGQASLNISGGSSPYTVTCVNANTGSLVDNESLPQGSYIVYVEDANNCSFSQSFEINEPPSANMQIELSDEISCLNPFTVSLTGLSSGGGNWSANGPGTISFSDPSSLSSIVNVSEYGYYEIIYTDDCGEEVNYIIEMTVISPSAVANPAITFCEFETTLEASSGSSEGSWSVLTAPTNTEVIFVDGDDSFSTPVVTSAINDNEECCYGEYLFSFNSCGDERLVSFEIQKEAPEFGISSYEECVLDGTIIIYNPTLDEGEWEVFNHNLGLFDIESQWEPIESNTLGINVSSSSYEEITFSVPEFGMYNFRYKVCGTAYNHAIGFSCPLTLPNVFTPNGDANNDIFTVFGLNNTVYSQINFTVFNQWGQIIHAQSKLDDNNFLWDGTTNTFNDNELSDGVYYYTLELFNMASNKKEEYSGFIHLFTGEPKF